jgi:hypothetical protein
MASFSDVLFVRVLLGSFAVVFLGIAAALAAVSIRLFTGWAIPGWSTGAVGIAAVIVLQGLTLSITASFMTLSNRANLVFIPAVNEPLFIHRIEELIPRGR